MATYQRRPQTDSASPRATKHRSTDAEAADRDGAGRHGMGDRDRRSCPFPLARQLRSGPEFVLDMQRAVGNRQVQKLLQRTATDRVQHVAGQAADGAVAQRKGPPSAGGPRPKAHSGPRGKDDQEQSWANPRKTPATEPALVATIYFRTKEFATDTQDNAVLLQIAKAYAPWAERNRGKRDAEQGLRGRIVGYADPRPSWEPNNAELSAKRAATVERRLLNALMLETSLQGGHFQFEKKAGGVAPADLENDKRVEEVSLGWQRRAEVYIAGIAMEPEPRDQDDPPPEPVIPEPEKYPDDFDKYLFQIKSCRPGVAKGLAMRLLGYFSWSKLNDIFRYTGTLPLTAPIPKTKGARVGGIFYCGNPGEVLPLRPKKPPWWDSRSSGYADDRYLHRRYRPAPTKCDKLLRASMMMIRDMREVNRYIDLTVEDASSAYGKFIEELCHTDAPEVQKLREYAVPIEYLMFMWDATKNSTLEVAALDDALDAE